MKAIIKLAAILATVFTVSCYGGGDSSDASPYHYVKPTIDYRGRFRKGHVRKDVSTNPNAIRNQSRSRYYYQTRGKYMRRSRNR